MIPWSATDSCTRTCCCWCGGNTSMIRSIVCAVSWVCRVANTRWPVSAAVSAVEIVSRSRISPTRITSGSWRRAALRPSEKLCASLPISRWFTTQFWWRCRNSIGSSIVRMCSCRFLLISSIIAASDVDLPEPVGPVTSTKPRGFFMMSWITGGRPSWSTDLISDGIRRNARADRGALHVGVDPEAPEPGHRVGEVDLPLLLEPLALVVRKDRVDDVAGVLGRERRVALERTQLAAHADHRRRADGQVEVRRVQLDDFSSRTSAKSISIRLLGWP